jgi:hypothetical protein
VLQKRKKKVVSLLTYNAKDWQWKKHNRLWKFLEFICLGTKGLGETYKQYDIYLTLKTTQVSAKERNERANFKGTSLNEKENWERKQIFPPLQILELYVMSENQIYTKNAHCRDLLAIRGAPKKPLVWG